MDLILYRKDTVNETTLGSLFINGKFFCHTLEDAVREEKIYGKTAIPAGKYEVIINWSNRFKSYMPLLLRVPNFEGVRIHPGNKKEDTHGCILVGDKISGQSLELSRIAYTRLMSLLLKQQRLGKIFITIR